jgi:4-amino-4-deoxy-L-arabinose transferase-like glycosyltransferase
MPAYEETQPRLLPTILTLAILALAIYQPFFLGDWELRGREDRFAAIALEMNIIHPDTVAHGELVPFHYPLFPWLAALMLKTGLPTALCLRLVSVISMLLVTVLVWEAGRRACDRQTATVGAAFFLSNLLVIEKSMSGYPYFTSVLFVFAAWLAWFTYGVVRGKWSLAWIVSFFFCGLGFFTDGWTPVLIFVIPLVFMRRPMTVWPKLRKPGFFLGGAVLLALILIWVLPHWFVDNQMPFQDISSLTQKISSYFTHLLTYPFEVALRLLPWSLLAWPAFCVAYFPLIKNQMFSRFLRTIVISLFFFFWIAPTSTAQTTAYIIPALSILCGINYWLLIRRHGIQLRRLFRFFSLTAVVFAAGGIVFYLLPASWLSPIKPLAGDLSFRNSSMLFGICESVLALLAALTAFVLSRKSLRIHTHVLLLSTSVSLIFWALHIPYRVAQTTKSDLGHDFAAVIKKNLGIQNNAPLPSDLVVFKGPHIVGLFGPCVYMGATVKKVRSIASIPDEPETVYMIATQFPVSKKRIWEYVSSKDNPLVYKETNLYILKGRRVKTDKTTTPTGS